MSFSKNSCQFFNVRIVSDPEEHVFDNGGRVLNFQIVDNQYDKRENKDVGHFFNCKFFISADSKNPSFWVDKCRKGELVSISGIATQERWEKDGAKHSKVVFIVRELIPHYQPPKSTGTAGDMADKIGGEVVGDEEVPF